MTPNKHHSTHFETRKLTCLSKRDKSSAGRIDPKAVDVCAVINDREEYYTTSSCAGRCYMYCGDGIKSWHSVENSQVQEAEEADNGGTPAGFFRRFRVNHDLVRFPRRFFDLTTIESDPSGGGDPIPQIGQFDQLGNNAQFAAKLQENSHQSTGPVWLRFEPFILHVMCRSMKSASVLMNLARPSFKNVGLTSWNDNVSERRNELKSSSKNDNEQLKGGGPRYLVSIVGDEGLDTPLSLPASPDRGLFYDPRDEASVKNAEWLAQLVNERHTRNWKKIDRFVQAIRSLDDNPVDASTIEGADTFALHQTDDSLKSAREATGLPIPRSFDVVGDVVILNSLPEGDRETQRMVGEWITGRNKAWKICIARVNNLATSDRCPGEGGYVQLAGHHRNPIVTSHYEYGIKAVIDLEHCFFSPRMAPERLRLSQSVARGERVLVIFAGVGMEALQISARTEAKSVLAVEKNSAAVECLRRARRMLERNKTATCPGGGEVAAQKLQIEEGDVLEILPTLEEDSFDRIVAPRPKEGVADGDLGTGDAGKQFLRVMLPLLKSRGECHWYDFAADHELPHCERTRNTIQSVCDEIGLGNVEVIHVAKVGSVAKRQFRVCLDFRIIR
mmetsp:Transcript_37110/g.88817  ORF Transcript_37110/g.88817 Transcript_37110/m.88817 type:complete len:616 (+) Transcript_37110:131-1978(+)